MRLVVLILVVFSAIANCEVTSIRACHTICTNLYDTNEHGIYGPSLYTIKGCYARAKPTSMTMAFASELGPKKLGLTTRAWVYAPARSES